ncbi:uncharacterized protein BX663DRAFT_495173 [Cokeromyces recurvatus]|uniref:uncharacterized protein n=1 Tax=Cokeromyces recurvatus TaxID=90255 RepID=UPI0022209E63|nr:uncharacterized protein BX663DRAFT_495173 [Cokeromyces recurvatus]KAI7907203.1 hypothetical protein BX663DRAFT_495173 [Cokeromyces recurvatus]
MSVVMKSGQPVQTTGKNLVGLWRPSFVKVDHRIFVYGGGGNVTNDLHVLNLIDMKWETLKTVKGTPPCKRYGHTASLWNNCIIIFGGCNEYQEYCNDVHLFNIEKMTWFQPEFNGSIPARYLHTASVYDDKLFIYGGFAKNSDCTYVLDELSILDLKTFHWTKHHGIPPRYNHSATLIGHKMYIYAGKDEHGSTVSDLFVVNLNTPPYTPHLVLSTSNNSQMVLLKSQHFCEAICGKLVIFGRYLINNNTNESSYGLWMLDLDTFIWDRQDCNGIFEVGGWNYFTILQDNQQQQQVNLNNLFFLGNTDPFRPQGYDHFRDALMIDSETLGLFDIPSSLPIYSGFSKLLNNPELSDFIIVPANGQSFFVHRVILITRWPHFRNMYKSGMIESQQGRMEIPEPYQVVFAFLKYLYNDRLDDTESCDTICHLLILANMYLLNRLKKLCCERLYENHLSVENCGIIFEKAIASEEIGLKTLALNFMFRHLGQILKTDILIEMSPMVRKEFLDAVPEDAVLDIHHHQYRQNNYSPNSLMQMSSSKLSFKVNHAHPNYTLYNHNNTLIRNNTNSIQQQNNSIITTTTTTTTTTNNNDILPSSSSTTLNPSITTVGV